MTAEQPSLAHYMSLIFSRFNPDGSQGGVIKWTDGIRWDEEQGKSKIFSKILEIYSPDVIKCSEEDRVVDSERKRYRIMYGLASGKVEKVYLERQSKKDFDRWMPEAKLELEPVDFSQFVSLSEIQARKIMVQDSEKKKGIDERGYIVDVSNETQHVRTRTENYDWLMKRIAKQESDLVIQEQRPEADIQATARNMIRNIEEGCFDTPVIVEKTTR